MLGRVLGCKGMHVRGARSTGARRQARGAHGRSAGASEHARWGVWFAGVRADGRLARGHAAARAATGVLLTREHVLHPKSPK
ncbi:hypothetical protein CRG98_016474 [Punica granatum]|uniref:Uncharacterized protein n=1 Tax=Punica granatum TaxID=22663 RepID=A0A2I0K3M6_PUNGR|nr:hypothetical protein CRG98_016474 [Punica granatum]